MSVATELSTLAIEKDRLRRFGWTMAGMIGGFLGVVVPLLKSGHIAVWPLPIAAAFALAALTRPLSLKRVYEGWMHFGHVMGAINSFIILTVLFTVVVVPLGWIMRLRGADPLQLRFDPGVSSYKNRTSPGSAASSMRRPF
jgi:hypothetical protein